MQERRAEMARFESPPVVGVWARGDRCEPETWILIKKGTAGRLGICEWHEEENSCIRTRGTRSAEDDRVRLAVIKSARKASNARKRARWIQ